MKIKIRESQIRQIIKETVKKALDEKVVDQFTPYTPEDRIRNFSPYFGGDTRSLEQRNDSYRIAKEKADEWRRQKALEKARREAGQEPEKIGEAQLREMVKKIVREAINKRK